MDIAERIKLVRGNLSQDEFAKKLNIHKNSLGRYERGESIPGVDVAEKICSDFGVNPQWLLLGLDPMRKGGEGEQERGTRTIASAGETAPRMEKNTPMPLSQCDECEKRITQLQERVAKLTGEKFKLLHDVAEARKETADARSEVVEARREGQEAVTEAYKQTIGILRDLALKGGGITTDVPGSAANALSTNLTND